jgi:trk system potassium uptake protein TrkH
MVLLGYLSYVVVGWLLLCLPFAHRAGNALDHLFTATSAASTTGLATVGTPDGYTLFGQIIILVLIQLGGIGYMTLGSFFVLSRREPLSTVRQNVGQAVFSLPESFRIDKFIRSVIRFTIAIETVGATALFFLFRDAGVEAPLWQAIFHAVSAFCTAGFSLNPDSLVRFAGHTGVNLTIAALAFLGAVGFIVFVDLTRMILGKVRKVTLTTKIILWSTFWMTVAGTLIVFVSEPALRDLPAHRRLLASFFQAMTAQTTVGFNTIDIAGISKASVLLLIVLMVVGSSPSGTGGGIKCTTATAILGVMRSAARGESGVRFWGRSIPADRVQAAVAVLGFYILTLLAGTWLLELTESTPFDQNFFEVASAVGTVGLSMGITPGLSALGKLVVIVLMFSGRVGPMTLGTALFTRRTGEPPVRDSDLAV